MNGLRAAVTFLTIAPVGTVAEARPAGAVAWYGPVGLALGGLLAAAVAGAWWLLPAPAAAAVIVATWVALTGALHLDGVADTADAAFAPVPRARRLEILRDVHHGTFGLAAVALVLLLKFAALASLPAREAAGGVLLAAVAGRAVVAPAMATFPSARGAGMGSEARPGASHVAIGVSLGLLVGTAGAAFGWQGIAAGGGAGVVAAVAGGWLSHRFGGLTGDCYGALVELVETTVVVSAAGLAKHGVGAFPWTS